jgi:hypothetical protein
MNLRAGINDGCGVNAHQKFSKAFHRRVRRVRREDELKNRELYRLLGVLCDLCGEGLAVDHYFASAVSEFARPVPAALGTSWQVTMASAAFLDSR